MIQAAGAAPEQTPERTAASSTATRTEKQDDFENKCSGEAPLQKDKCPCDLGDHSLWVRLR